MVEQKGFEPSTPSLKFPRELASFFAMLRRISVSREFFANDLGQTDLPDRGSLLLFMDSRRRPMQSDQTGGLSPIACRVSSQSEAEEFSLAAPFRYPSGLVKLSALQRIRPVNSMTQRKVERYHRSLKNRILYARHLLRMDHRSDSLDDKPASARAYLAGVPRAWAAQQTTNHHKARGSSGQEPRKRYREVRPSRI
jgi:hypothetical protein